MEELFAGLEKDAKERLRDAFKGGLIYNIKLERINFKDVTFTGHWSEEILIYATRKDKSILY